MDAKASVVSALIAVVVTAPHYVRPEDRKQVAKIKLKIEVIQELRRDQEQYPGHSYRLADDHYGDELRALQARLARLEHRRDNDRLAPWVPSSK